MVTRETRFAAALAELGETTMIYDSSTRQVYSKSQWSEKRVSRTEGARPLVPIHTLCFGELDEATHRYRLVTFGMVKFGLADLVVSDVAVTEPEVDDIQAIVHFAAQRIADLNGRLPPDGALTIEMTALPELGIPPSARGRAMLRLGKAVRLPMDPRNTLFELVFPDSPEPSIERHRAVRERLMAPTPH
jgi:hypothetical protein